MILVFLCRLTSLLIPQLFQIFTDTVLFNYYQVKQWFVTISEGNGIHLTDKMSSLSHKYTELHSILIKEVQYTKHVR